MKKNSVTITIRSLQAMETGEETMTQRGEGFLCWEEECWLLSYWEGKDSGLGRMFQPAALFVLGCEVHRRLC